MEPLVTSLLYSLRFLAILSAVLLWAVAISDIRRHAREGSFATAQLAATAVAVSIVAAGTVAAIIVAVPPGPPEPQTKNAADLLAEPGREGFSYSFTYSFGLRRPAPQECRMKPTENSLLPHVTRQGIAATGDESGGADAPPLQAATVPPSQPCSTTDGSERRAGRSTTVPRRVSL